MKCTYDPSGISGGMFHCPQCGEMVVAGTVHPDYTEGAVRSLDFFPFVLTSSEITEMSTALAIGDDTTEIKKRIYAAHGHGHPDYNETERNFREAWLEALAGDVLPIAQLWDTIADELWENRRL